MRRNLRDNCDEKFRGGETETHSQDFPPRTSMGCSARFAYTLKRRLDRARSEQKRRDLRLELGYRAHHVTEGGRIGNEKRSWICHYGSSAPT